MVLLKPVEMPHCPNPGFDLKVKYYWIPVKCFTYLKKKKHKEEFWYWTSQFQALLLEIAKHRSFIFQKPVIIFFSSSLISIMYLQLCFLYSRKFRTEFEL